jgi:type I restriction enzyme M protein
MKRQDLRLRKEIKKGKEDPLYGNFRDNGKIVEYEVDTELRDTEQIPLSYPGGIEAFFKDRSITLCARCLDRYSKTQIGYEISFTKYFYKPVKLRSTEEIITDIKALEAETDGLLDEIIGG